MFEDFGGAPTPFPAADVYETEADFVIELEVPGYEEKELAVDLTDHALRVTGERTTETETKDKSFLRRERLESSFERCFTLPPDVETDKLVASFGKGVLAIHAPKPKEIPPRKISIETK
jgi:HSP20 family protein